MSSIHSPASWEVIPTEVVFRTTKPHCMPQRDSWSSASGCPRWGMSGRSGSLTPRPMESVPVRVGMGKVERGAGVGGGGPQNCDGIRRPDPGTARQFKERLAGWVQPDARSRKAREAKANPKPRMTNNDNATSLAPKAGGCAEFPTLGGSGESGVRSCPWPANCCKV